MKQRNSNTPPMPEGVTSVNIGTDYFINLEDSIKFDFRLISESKTEVKSPIELFIDENYSNLSIPDNRINLVPKKKALNTILTNVVIANEGGKVVSI